MLEYAELLTINPSGIVFDDGEQLRQCGWQDEDVVDIVHIVGAFNYLVRMADGLGIALQPEWSEHAHELSFLEGKEPKPVANEISEAGSVHRSQCRDRCSARPAVRRAMQQVERET